MTFPIKESVPIQRSPDSNQIQREADLETISRSKADLFAFLKEILIVLDTSCFYDKVFRQLLKLPGIGHSSFKRLAAFEAFFHY